MNRFALVAVMMLLAPLIAGIAVKIADDLNDIEQLRRHRRFGGLSALIASLCMAAMIFYNPGILPLIAGVMLGVMVTRKIDNRAFIAMVLILSGSLAACAAFRCRISLAVVAATLVFALMGIADEWGNDAQSKSSSYGFMRRFFEWRCTMKLGVPLFALLFGRSAGIGPWEVAAFLMFDIGYGVSQVMTARLVRDVPPDFS